MITLNCPFVVATRRTDGRGGAAAQVDPADTGATPTHKFRFTLFAFECPLKCNVVSRGSPSRKALQRPASYGPVLERIDVAVAVARAYEVFPRATVNCRFVDKGQSSATEAECSTRPCGGYPVIAMTTAVV